MDKQDPFISAEPIRESTEIAELKRQLSVERGKVKLLRESLNRRFSEGLRMGQANSDRALKSLQEAKDDFYSQNEILTNHIEQLEKKIAVIPGLIEALEKLVKSSQKQNWSYSYADDITAAKAAIAKAKGEHEFR